MMISEDGLIITPLDGLVKEKEQALEQLDIAVNEYISLKNKYAVKSNELRIQPDKIKEDMGLSKAPTEKQQQAYIDDKLKDLLQNKNIAKENVSSWKRKADLIETKINAEYFRFSFMEVMK